MRIPRVFLDTKLKSGDIVSLDARAHHHVVNVLRLGSENPLILFNGSGGEYEANLENVSRKTAYARLHTYRETERESSLKIRLMQGISRTDHMDQTLQKAVELGVHSLLPVFTERSNGRMSTERIARKIQHWRGILISACEQCGRNYLPNLESPVSIQDIAALTVGACGIVLAPGSPTTLSQLRPNPEHDFYILIGPEGGLTIEEIDMASQKNFTPVRLGARILRTETAGLAVIAIAQMLWGDLGS